MLVTTFAILGSDLNDCCFHDTRGLLWRTMARLQAYCCVLCWCFSDHGTSTVDVYLSAFSAKSDPQLSIPLLRHMGGSCARRIVPQIGMEEILRVGAPRKEMEEALRVGESGHARWQRKAFYDATENGIIAWVSLGFLMSLAAEGGRLSP